MTIECPEFIISFVRNRIQEWADEKNKNRGLMGIWGSVFRPTVPIPNTIVTQYSCCDLELVACKGDLIGRWFVTIAKTIACDPKRNIQIEDGVPTEITKMMLFDFSISGDQSEFFIVQTDMDGHAMRGVHRFFET
ncbi:MAG TPA: hypothetical protein VGJ73_06215 [Verrucomicrobiae bacterium]